MVAQPPTPPYSLAESRKEEAKYILEEARMVLPGIQALFGFQLIAVFNARFHELSSSRQFLHLGGLVLVALSAAIIMTPAAYHRLAERGALSSFFVRLSSALVAIALLPLALAISIDIFLVAIMILGDTLPSVVLAGGVLVVFLAAWFVYPLAASRGRPRDGTCSADRM